MTLLRSLIKQTNWKKVKIAIFRPRKLTEFAASWSALKEILKNALQTEGKLNVDKDKEQLK